MNNNINDAPIRFVVCAANKCDDRIVLGARHYDTLMNAQIRTLSYCGFNPTSDKWEQGFIDQYGLFMNREEALLVATVANQINTRRTKTNPVSELYSEDLY